MVNNCFFEFYQTVLWERIMLSEFFHSLFSSTRIIPELFLIPLCVFGNVTMLLFINEGKQKTYKVSKNCK